MGSALSRNWWTLVLRGVFALAFGLLTLVWPGLTFGVLVILFGAYALVDGLFAIVSSVRGHKEPRQFWMLFVEGIVGIGAGLITFIWPGATALALVVLVAAWAILTGVLELFAAVRLRQEVRGEFLLAIAGVLSVGWGVLMLIWPGPGALVVVWMLGCYAVFFGVLLMALGIRLRTATRHIRISHDAGMGGLAHPV